MNEPTKYDKEPDLHNKVFEALGTASVCWEDMSGTGVFQEQIASKVGKELIEWINANYVLKIQA